MNIKSLLLGSAAALVAVTGARAADVIMVEPEPVEYVRVCDVYGTGFYYIPGTETCIQISGYVRMQFTAASDSVNLEGDDESFSTRVRTRLNFDIREETELGLLRAYARVQADNNGNTTDSLGSLGAAAYGMDQAYIQLGGLTMGYRDTLWSSNIGGLEDGLLTDTDLIAGDIKTNQVSYTFALGGFSAVIGLEDDETGDFAPDVHGKLVYSGAWGGAFLSAVYDETVNSNFGFSEGNFEGFDFDSGGFDGFPTLFEDGSNDAFALKAGAKLNDLFVEGSTLALEGHYAFDPTPYASLGSVGTSELVGVTAGGAPIILGASVPLIAEWALGAGYRQDVGEFTVAVAGQYGELFDVTVFDGPVAPFTPFEVGGGEFYRLVGNVGYSFTNNFGALAEVSYTDVEFDDIDSVNQTAGFLRFVRSF